MSTARLNDFPSLVDFGEQLERRAAADAEVVRAAAPARGGARRLRRIAVVALAGLALVLIAGVAAAATLLVVKGDPIPPFARADDAATIRPIPGTGTVADVRGADPAAGVPPWAVRVSRGADATACIAVGQVDGGQFGLVGLDGRFRTLPVRGTDSCGAAPDAHAPIVAARQFAGKRAADVRTVLFGLGGPGLKSVRVTVIGGGAARTLHPSAQGAFVTVYRGRVDALHPLAMLRYGHGKNVVQGFGGGRYDATALGFGSFITWRIQPYPAGPGVLCVRMVPTPQMHPTSTTPSACGPAAGVFFDSATLKTGDHGPGGGRYFRGYRFRGRGTYVWGAAPKGSRVELLGGKRLMILPGHRGPLALPLAPDGSFGATLSLPLRAAQVRLAITPPGGPQRVYREHTGLVFRGSTQ